MNVPPAPQEGPPERQNSPEETVEQLPDYSDGLPVSAKGQFDVAYLPDTGEVKAKGTATARVTEAVGMGVGGPAVTLTLGSYAHLGPNWMGTLIIIELGLAGWLGLKGRKSKK